MIPIRWLNINPVTPKIHIILLTKVKMVLSGAPLGPMYFRNKINFVSINFQGSKIIDFMGSDFKGGVTGKSSEPHGSILL